MCAPEGDRSHHHKDKMLLFRHLMADCDMEDRHACVAAHSPREHGDFFLRARGRRRPNHSRIVVEWCKCLPVLHFNRSRAFCAGC